MEYFISLLGIHVSVRSSRQIKQTLSKYDPLNAPKTNQMHKVTYMITTNQHLLHIFGFVSLHTLIRPIFILFLHFGVLSVNVIHLMGILLRNRIVSHHFYSLKIEYLAVKLKTHYIRSNGKKNWFEIDIFFRMR